MAREPGLPFAGALTAEAIRGGIVKKPILERVEVKNERTGQPLPLVQQAAPNAWKKYEHLLATGIERWVKVRDQLRAEGDDRKPILSVLCADKGEAAEVANFLAYANPARDDLSGSPVKGYVEPKGKERLFVEKGDDGIERSTVAQIHIGQKEDPLRLGAREAVVSRDAAEMRKRAGSFDFILDTVSPEHDLSAYLQLLRQDGNLRLGLIRSCRHRPKGSDGVPHGPGVEAEEGASGA